MVEVLAGTARTARETRALPSLYCIVPAEGGTTNCGWGRIPIIHQGEIR